MIRVSDSNNLLQSATIVPNPSNVVALLELAHQYDIPFLMRNCEDHLMQCYEISIIDRLLLARKYDLNALELRIMERGLSKQHFLELLADKREKLRDPECDFLFDIIQERLKNCSF
ncbi:hypothetical protein Ddc_24091 [Ditylenchus destructor]|nr:hypothetical protein Ddc_24091 [Ditylenchus destructor]